MLCPGRRPETPSSRRRPLGQEDVTGVGNCLLRVFASRSWSRPRRRPGELPHRPTVAAMHQIPNVGDRVRMTGVMNDPDPVAVGAEGTVNLVGSWTCELTRQIGVRWDNGRTLGLLEGDPFEVL